MTSRCLRWLWLLVLHPYSLGMDGYQYTFVVGVFIPQSYYMGWYYLWIRLFQWNLHIHVYFEDTITYMRELRGNGVATTHLWFFYVTNRNVMPKQIACRDIQSTWHCYCTDNNDIANENRLQLQTAAEMGQETSETKYHHISIMRWARDSQPCVKGPCFMRLSCVPEEKRKYKKANGCFRFFGECPLAHLSVS